MVEEEKEEGWDNGKSDVIGIPCANDVLYCITTALRACCMP